MLQISHVWIILFIFFILLVRERFLGHSNDRVWSTSSEEDSGRNGPVENATVAIAGNVDHQIDVDSDSSSEILEEVVRAPHGRARPPGVVAPFAIDPGLSLNTVTVKPLIYWIWKSTVLRS